MSFVQYNGVHLGFICTKQYRQEPVYIGTDVKGFRHTATWLVTAHRQTVGVIQNGALAPLGVTAVGNIVGVEQALLTPRKSLLWRQGSQTLASIAAPNNGAIPPRPGTVDVEWGVKPIAFVIVGLNGEGSYVAEYTISWTVRADCPERNGKQAVLAHIWKCDDTVDVDFYGTRTYTGVVHYDPNVVGPLSANLHPDQLRGLILPPRTANMYRQEVLVRTLEDGYSQVYRVTDKQPYAFVNSADVTRIEAEHTITHGVPGQATIWRNRAALARAASHTAAGVGRGVRGVGGARNPMELIGEVVGLAGEAPGLAAAGMDYWAHTYEAIPTVTNSITVVAFGNPTSRWKELAQAARVIALFRIMKSVYGPDGTLFDFGGKYQQIDRASPKATAITIELTNRPRTLKDEATWQESGPLMPTLVNGRLIPREVVGFRGRKVPSTIRQLIFGGSLTGPNEEDWGWADNAFARDYVSNTDALRPTGVERGIDPSNTARGGPLALALMGTPQNPCENKTYATFNKPTPASLP